MQRHGMTKTPEYYSWASMKSRCLNPKNDRYAEYGGRGITICKRWIDSFENFYADMGPRPDKTTLERRDTDGNYEPENCCWATQKEQQSNRRNNNLLTHDGVTLTITEWSRRLGFKERAIAWRLRNGWSVDRALTEPRISKYAKRNPASGYNGVRCTKGLYFACLRIDGKRRCFGGFSSFEDAARGYDKLARKHYGDKAVLNFPEEHGETLAQRRTGGES